jgi:hypothetical protein
MQNVALIYTARKLVGPTALKLYAFVGSLWMIGRLVWVSQVFDNLANVGWSRAFEFGVAAVLNTELMVQLFVLVGGLAAILLLLDVVRSVSPRFRTA